MVSLILMCITHFVADFLLQSRKMGQLKASDPRWLVFHIAIIWLAFTPFGLEFATFNAGIHGLIDSGIWNGYKLSVRLRHPTAKKETFRYWGDPWFYHTIGFDQLLHYLTIILLWSTL